MLTEDAMDAILDAIPDDLKNSEVAGLLATIASAFSEGRDVAAIMHLNTAEAMVLSKMINESRTLN